jgi:hypothetical protein
MAKKSKTEGKPKPQVWRIADSQIQLVQDQFMRHQRELEPLIRYQQMEQQGLFNAFRAELGIPPEVNLTADLEGRQFTEKLDALQHNNMGESQDNNA